MMEKKVKQLIEGGLLLSTISTLVPILGLLLMILFAGILLVLGLPAKVTLPSVVGGIGVIMFSGGIILFIICALLGEFLGIDQIKKEAKKT